jgi:hypothetical protein
MRRLAILLLPGVIGASLWLPAGLRPPVRAVAAEEEAASEQAAADDEQQADDEAAANSLAINGACYVCHIPFVGEEVGRVHVAEQIGCIKCHGLSAAHANDEHVGATPPDVVYKREEVDRMCLECHETHKAPATAVVGRFVERKLPARPAPICTDCHGTHRIEEAAADK